MTYTYSLESAKQTELSGLVSQCQSAGLPVEYVNGSPDAGLVHVVTSRELTGAEELQLAGLVEAYDGRPRRLRSLHAILSDIVALSGPQQSAIWSDLTSGSPPKWRTTSDDQLVWSKASQGTTSTTEKQVAVAFYLREHVDYLVNPSFSPTIFVPGDEVDE